MHIRRLSRQHRLPKRDVAAEIVEAAGIHMVRPPDPLDAGEESPSRAGGRLAARAKSDSPDIWRIETRADLPLE